MSKDVFELEKTEQILVFKIVEQYKSIKRKNLIALVIKYYNEFFDKEVSENTVINWIREITKSEDKRSKIPALVSKSGYYRINNEVVVKPKAAMRGIWDEIDQHLKIRRENKIISNEIRMKHSEKIKKRVIKPLIEWISVHNMTPAKLPVDVLFEDLDNHIPPDLEDPKKILKEIDEINDEIYKKENKIKRDLEKIAREVIKSKNWRVVEVDESIRGVGWAPSLISETLLEWLRATRDKEVDKILPTLENFLENSLKSIKCEATSIDGEEFTSVFMPSLIYRGKEVNRDEIAKRVAELFGDIIKSDGMKNVLDDMKKLRELENKIKDLKQKVLSILKELEAYEILPGACKYISS